MTEFSVKLTEDPIATNLEASSYKIPIDEGSHLYFYNDQKEVIAIFNSTKWTSLSITGTLS